MTDEETIQPEAIIAVYPTGQIVIGRGYDVGTVLDALDLARRAVRGIRPSVSPGPSVRAAEAGPGD